MTIQDTDIPEGWHKTSLGKYIDIKHGYAFSGQFITDIENANVLLTPGNFLVGGGWKDGKKFYSGSDIPKDYILQSGDMVITMTDLSKDGDTLGYPAIIQNNPNINYLHNQRIGLVQFTGEKINKDYLYWKLRTKEYQKFIVNSATGSTVRHTSPGRIRQYEFNIPDITEQKEIASILSSFDDKIELLGKQNETLERTAQTIFQEWFGKYSVDDELPEGWKVGKVKDFVDILSGFAFKSDDFSENGEYRLITIANVQDGLFIENTKDGLMELPPKMPEYCNLKTGDILLSLTGNVGRVCHVIGENYLLNQRVAKLKARNHTDYGFVYLFFRQPSFLTTLINISVGTAQQNLSPIKTAEVEAIIPDRLTLSKLGEVINPMIDRILANLMQIQKLTKARDTLLPKLMKEGINGFNA